MTNIIIKRKVSHKSSNTVQTRLISGQSKARYRSYSLYK